MQKKNVTFLASLGAGLEYYDFVIYGLMTPFLAKLFFSQGGLFATLATFTVGYAARPIGGILAGMLADRLGRKNTFLVVMLIMACSTFAIGLLPDASVWGPISALLLVLLRVLQGLSFGAELPGAMTVVSEYTSANKRGIHCGFVLSSTAIGALLGSFVLYLINNFFKEATILEWAWRIPFLLGGILAVVSYIMRTSMDETPEFLEQKHILNRQSFWTPLRTLVKDHWTQVLLACGLSLLPSSLIITNIFYPTLLKGVYSYTQADLYLATTYSLLWSAVTTPLCGWAADYFGKERLFFMATLVFGPMILGAFNLLSLGGFKSLVVFMILNQIAISLLMSSYFSLLAGHFPVNVRYTGIAFCGNSMSVLTSMLPMGFSALLTRGFSSWSIPFILIGISFVAAFAAFKVISNSSQGLESAELPQAG